MLALKSKNKNIQSALQGWRLSMACAALVLTAILPGLVSPVFAQMTPSQSATDELLRNQERERILREQQERTPDVRLPEPETPQGLERLPNNETGCVNIKNITLIGDDDADRFQWAISAANHTAGNVEDKATGRCLGSRGVNLVMRRIQNALISRGFVTARVLAGAQAYLAEGNLELTLLPGRIRRIQFAPGTSWRATKWNAVPVKSGDLLNLRDMEQAMENFKRVPTIEANIEFRAPEDEAAEPGQSDIVVQWQQSFPLRVSLSVDDAGAKDTGKYQGTATVSVDNPLTLSDLFYASVNRSLVNSGAHGSHGYLLYYSLPFDYWLLGLTTSQNRYHQSVAGASQTYLYSGESHNSEIKLSRLLYRDAVRKTTVSLKGWERASKNYIDDTEIEVQRRRMAGVEIGVSHREFIGSAMLEASVNYRYGTGAWNSLPAPEEAYGQGTSRPKIITADMQISTPFQLGRGRLRHVGTWRAQWNKTPLVPQDRFAIGGRYTVRGFDGENQLVAERGWLMRNDLGWALGQSGQEFYGGIDYGQVSGPTSDTLVGKRISGAVLGLRGAVKEFSYDTFAGKPISKPKGYQTSSSVAGFNVNWSF